LRAVFVLVFILAVVLKHSACLFIGAFLLGLGGVLFNPASQAYLPHIVKSGDLAEANAISSTTSGFVSVFSTILGGVVATFISPVICFSVNSVSYLWSAFFVSKLLTVKEHAAATRSLDFIRSLSEGLEEVKRNQVARKIIIIGISWGLAGGGYYILIPLIGNTWSGMEGMGIGLLYSVDGLGVISGSLLVKKHIKQQIARMHWFYGIAYVTQAVFFTGIALCSDTWWTIFMLYFMRVSSGIIIPLDSTILQINTAPEVRGRVFALHGSTYGGFMQLSYLTSSLMFANLGITLTGAIIGSVSLFCGMYWLAGMQHRKRIQPPP
jgi:MFS family permease